MGKPVTGAKNFAFGAIAQKPAYAYAYAYAA